MSAAGDEILKRLADAIDDGRDDDGAIELAQWRRQVAVDKLEELAAKGPSPLLCGPDPMECHGRVEIDGFTLECPLRGACPA